MSVLKVKTPAKMFTSNLTDIQHKVVETLDEVLEIVGGSLGPHGRNVLIESDLIGIPNVNTKDGVSIFKSLGHQDPAKHLIIEQTRDAAIKTVAAAGDGTTTATILAATLTKNLFAFCNDNRKYSPQKVVRYINKIMKDSILPDIQKMSIKITAKNTKLLEQVATISSNGDKEMAAAVISAFDEVGYSSSSHVTIQELSGEARYEANVIEGFPITKGYEESIGKFHNAFINDQAHRRCLLEKPLYILFDGTISDMVQIQDVLENIGQEYISGNSDYSNLVIISHRFSDKVLNNLALNFNNPLTINVVPLTTPLSQITNAQQSFLLDVSAFTGAKIFDMNNPLVDATPEDFGSGMEKIEIYRFRTTIIGDPDPVNVEVRADDLKVQIEQSESKIEKIMLEEKLGKLTSGIAQLKIYGASNGELKEKADRAEDAVCAVRAAITDGCLPGGCRALVNAALNLDSKDPIVSKVLIPSLFSPLYKLLDNAGYSIEEIDEIIGKMFKDKKIVYDVENGVFGDPKKLGIYDATLAVEQALKNAFSIASVMGTMGGIICFPRNNNLEQQNAMAEKSFNHSLDNAEKHVNEANVRG